MAKPVTAEERERIIAAFATGASCRQIAKQFGRAIGTISAIAAETGHEFGRSNVLRAVEINQRYGAEWRATAKQRMAEAFNDFMDDLKKPTLVYSFGGKDNVYNEHTLDKPDAKTKRDIINSAAVAYRTIEAMEKADNGGDGSAADALLAFFGNLQAEHGTSADDAASQPETEAEHRLEHKEN